MIKRGQCLDKNTWCVNTEILLLSTRKIIVSSALHKEQAQRLEAAVLFSIIQEIVWALELDSSVPGHWFFLCKCG